jgi:hypothetical protein
VNVSSTTVTIDGKNVSVPNHEIPRIIGELTKAYTQQLTTSTAKAAEHDNFITYQKCEEILAAKAGYAGRTLKVHAGNLWGAMCRLTKHGRLLYETLCDSCGGRVQDKGGKKKPRCSHPHPSMGYRLVLIRYASIVSNFEQLRQLEFQRGPSVKQDYLYLLDGLTGQPS